MAAVGGIQAGEGPMQAGDVAALQRELDAIPGAEYGKFRDRGPSLAAEERDALYAKWPVLRRLDDGEDARIGRGGRRGTGNGERGTG